MGTNVSNFALVLIVGVVCVTLAGVAGIVLLVESNNAQSAAIILGFLAPTIASLFALVGIANQGAKSEAQHTETVSSLGDLKSQLAANTSTVTDAIAAPRIVVPPHDTSPV